MRVELSRFTGRRSIGANEPFVVFAGSMGNSRPGLPERRVLYGARRGRTEPGGRNGASCTTHPSPVPQREIDSMSGSQSESPRSRIHHRHINKAWLGPREHLSE